MRRYRLVKFLFVWMMLVGGGGSKVFSQPDHLFRIYEDNDFINIAGKGTDKGYTNGTRFDYFYLKKTPSHFFLDKWFPTAGAGAVDTYSYSLMQVMLGPKDISKPEPDKNDWPYAAALVASHGMYSTHPGRELAIQTEITAGVIGPLALGRQFQTWAHSIIGYTKPRGWDKQMPNDVLLNINLQAWKMIWQPGKALELMGGRAGAGRYHARWHFPASSAACREYAAFFQQLYRSVCFGQGKGPASAILFFYKARHAMVDV